MLPFLFNQLLLLGSTPRIEELGWRLTRQADIGVELWRVIGRTAVLLLFTEVLLVGIGFVMDRRWLKEVRLHALIVVSAVLAAATPQIADFGSTGIGPLARPMAIAAVALAFAGLWGQVFLVTGVLLDAFRSRRPSWRLSARHWQAGAVKGAIYGGLFMALVQICAIVAGSPTALSLAGDWPVPVMALLGAILFPLLRTIVESFDGSAALRSPAADAMAGARGLMSPAASWGWQSGWQRARACRRRHPGRASCSAWSSVPWPMPARTWPRTYGPSSKACAGGRVNGASMCWRPVSAVSSAAPSPGISTRRSWR